MSARVRNLSFGLPVDPDTSSFAGVAAVDCYFHNAVPSVAVCRDCQRTICATCRDEQGLCPSCRLEQRIKAAQSANAGLTGQVGPSNPPPQWTGPATQRSRPPGALASVSGETRALLALGYPLWPLAALALLDPKRSPQVRRQAMQALALNFGTFGLWIALGAVAHVPLLGLSAWPLLALLVPIWLVATIVYALLVWNGEDVRV
ncbi:MAG: DUF4870 domain-containing protein, partial [Candidatus Baltobacteraceae bacterium]